MQHFLSQLCQDLDSPSVSVWFPGDIHVKEVTLTTIVLVIVVVVRMLTIIMVACW